MFGSDTRGAAFVEAAIAFPFIIALGFLTIEVSNWLYQHHALTTGVRDAARYLARSPNPSSNKYQSNAKNLVCYGDVGATNTSPKRVIGCDETSNVTVSLTSVDNSAAIYRGPITITLITVTTNFKYKGICSAANSCTDFASVFGFPFTNISLNVSHTERYIGG